MDLNNIKRNQLDYILTDILPTELSERFTFFYFYEFLMTKRKELKQMNNFLISVKNKYKTGIMFEGGGSGHGGHKGNNWVTMPLKYSIMKELHTEREISLLQPIAAVELFAFVSIYQKELINLIDMNSIFSLRHHHKNNELCYKNKNKSITKYFAVESAQIDKDLIEKTGMFFDIKPYKSIASFTSSEEWLVLNSKYRYFIRTDYKACFDSIYTHTFKWLIGKDVNDTKDFKNTNIYTTIDRILQNINARTSNGIVVGPEFSRMIAEILLQAIDRTVYSKLLNSGKALGENYNVYRFVDDIFIFAESEELANEIVQIYSEISAKYLLRLNEAKLYKNTVPFVLDEWINETSIFANRTSACLFRTKEEQEIWLQKEKQNDLEKEIVPHILKSRALYYSKRSIMNQLNELICEYPSKDRTIVAYFLGTILNKVSRNKENVKIFSEHVTEQTVANFMDLIFYAYSFFPNYNNTQRFLSIVSYIRDEYDIFTSSEQLQKLVNKYAFIFDKANLNDIINLVLFCAHAKIEIPYRQEQMIVCKLREKDDPILWASYLLYSQYSTKYYKEIRDEIGEILLERIDAIIKKDSIYTYREFWWVIIFNKSPHLTMAEQSKVDHLINELKVSTATNLSAEEICGNLFVEFVKNNSRQFFEWDMEEKDFLRNYTFKTYERSIFKNYRENVTSLAWGSF